MPVHSILQVSSSVLWSARAPSEYWEHNINHGFGAKAFARATDDSI